MEIVDTRIPDVSMNNIDESKQILANNIIANIYPLFNDLHKGKEKEAVKYKDSILKLKSVLKHEKDSIDALLVRYSKAKKISKIMLAFERHCFPPSTPTCCWAKRMDLACYL